MTLTRRLSPFGEQMTIRPAMVRLFDDRLCRPGAGIAGTTFEHGILRLRVSGAEQVEPKQIRIQPVTVGAAKVVGPGDPAGPRKVGN